MHVQLRDCVLDRADDGEVVVPGEGGMDPALQADLCRAALPGLLASAHDLLVRHEVRRAAEARRKLPFRECAEAAAEIADVRVLDVARNDIGDLIAANVAPELVRCGEHAVSFTAARTKEPDDLVLAELLACVDRQGVAWDE